jgi:deoxyribose-phosphate aldolase
MNLAHYIDHTILKPTTTREDISQLCREAAEEGFAAVCVPPYFVSMAKELLRETNVKVATVIGFPFGYSTTTSKNEEIKQALEDGADEVDMVHNIAALKDANFDYLASELNSCSSLVRDAGKLIKVIVESGILTDEELIKCCGLYAPAGIDFMKTSTGYAATGATIHAVHTMRKHLPPHISIKASGGIRTFEFAMALVNAGATRLGCSASKSIMEEARTVKSQQKQ